MPREESTADDFPDKGDFLTPSAKRKKPDCDRKTLIPDPCDLRVDRRKKTDGNNDCAVAPIVQVCPEDLGKFKIPELPVVPTVFMPKRSEPITLAPLKVIPAPELECNDSFTLSCPSEGWLDADWARENLGESSGSSGEGYEIIEDQFGGVSNLKELNLDYDQLPDDPDIFIAPEDDEKEFGRQVIVTSCSFVAATKKEANKKARINAIRSLDCQFCNPELVVNCLDHQEMALGIGGEGYTAENTYIEIKGDGNGAAAEVVIEEGTGRVTGINVTSGGDKYTAILAEIIGDGIGAAIGGATLEDEDGCGGPLLSMTLGQVFPDPAYNPLVDPPIYSTQKGACVPKCTTTSRESVAVARDEALAEALRSLDCSYQSPELHKDCPEGEVPNTGFDMPMGAFKTPITRGTQLEVTESSQEIIDALTCIQIPCPDGFPEAIVDIQINDPNESCDDNGGGQNGSWFDASFDEANCEYKLEGVLELPEIPCACGFETTTSINGMTVISGSNVETNSNSECVGSLDIGIDVIGNTECELIFNLETCEFDLAIDLPDLKMKCEEISMGVSGGEFNATVNKSDTFGVDVTANGNGCVSGDGCSLDLELPSYELTINVPDINVPCPDGFNTETEISIEGGEICIGGECDTASGAFDFDFDINTCQFTGVMELNIPSINIGCGEFETSVAISGGNFTGPEPEEPGGGGDSDCSASLDITPTIETSGNASADFTISNCGFELDITLPDISMEVPCQTITASASGGTVDASIVTGGSAFGVSVTTTPEEPCVTGDGCGISIDIPSTSIEITVPDIDIPEIPCPEGFTAISSINIAGGVIEVTEDGNTTTVGGNPEANVNLTIDMNTCQIIQTMSLTLPNAEIEIPSVECANGYSASGSLGVSGGDVTAGNNVTVSNSTNASGNATLTSSNCGIELSGDIVLPSYQIDVDIPAMTCADGYSASGNIDVSGGSVSGGNNVTISGGNGGASSNVSFSQSQCAMEISGSIILPDLTIDVDLPNIPCANGYSVSGSPSVTGGSISGGNNVTVSGGNSGASGNLSLSGSGCNITLDGEITLPDVSIDVDLPACAANGYTFSGSATVSGGAVSGGDGITVSGGSSGASGNVTITESGCGVTLDGAITLPDITITASAATCPNGVSGEGTATVSGGAISGGEGITVSGGNSGASGNVTLSGSGCNLSLSGEISLPDVTITAEAIDCANVTGAMCEDDYTETSLDVCDSSGNTTSITVLVKT